VRRLNIALDCDGTYTADRELWDAFIKLAQARGHTVTIVTMRRECEAVKNPPCEVIYTARQAKERFYLADIWIDDQPWHVRGDHALLGVD
jgi:hypothetical protein